MNNCCARCNVGLSCIFDDDGPNNGSGSHGTHSRAEANNRVPHDSSEESDD